MPFVLVLKTTIGVQPDPFQLLLSFPIWYNNFVMKVTLGPTA